MSGILRGLSRTLAHTLCSRARAALNFQPPARCLGLEAALLFVDRRRRRVLQTDHVVEHGATLEHLAIPDPPLPIKRACHLEAMPVGVIGNDGWIVLARPRNTVTLPFEVPILPPIGGIPHQGWRAFFELVTMRLLAQLQDGVRGARCRHGDALRVGHPHQGASQRL